MTQSLDILVMQYFINTLSEKEVAEKLNLDYKQLKPVLKKYKKIRVEVEIDEKMPSLSNQQGHILKDTILDAVTEIEKIMETSKSNN